MTSKKILCLICYHSYYRCNRDRIKCKTCHKTICGNCYKNYQNKDMCPFCMRFNTLIIIKRKRNKRGTKKKKNDVDFYTDREINLLYYNYDEYP
jgi:hypothetical protein